ncbi:hypothetical protein [Nostoc sp.]|uniref:hypothetical protein n=1 Tax=Nostoc sp. TaxID=1180 RepID=UPI003594243E
MATSTVLIKLLMTTAGAILIALGIGGAAKAGIITTFYGDDDGFGVEAKAATEKDKHIGLTHFTN